MSPQSNITVSTVLLPALVHHGLKASRHLEAHEWSNWLGNAMSVIFLSVIISVNVYGALKKITAPKP